MFQCELRQDEDYMCGQPLQLFLLHQDSEASMACIDKAPLPPPSELGQFK